MRAIYIIIIFIILLILVFGVFFIYKELLSLEMGAYGESTYTGLHPFKLYLDSLRVTPSNGRFYVVIINVPNETVSIKNLNLTDSECSYGGYRSLYSKIKCWFLYNSKRSCVENYKITLNGIDFNILPVVVGPNKEFSLEFLNCEFLKNKKVGERSRIDLSIDYQIGNETFSTWGRIGAYYE